tara:strand:+ start:1367 stop:1525 length:159 start_codon:yes stop_codon:yes gene_type:complete
MKVTYTVARFSLEAGDLRSDREKVFDNVDDAISHHRQQKDGYFSWWEITVNY